MLPNVFPAHISIVMSCPKMARLTLTRSHRVCRPCVKCLMCKCIYYICAYSAKQCTGQFNYCCSSSCRDCMEGMSYPLIQYAQGRRCVCVCGGGGGGGGSCRVRPNDTPVFPIGLGGPSNPSPAPPPPLPFF